MADPIQILQDNTKERVAFDLMLRIIANEGGAQDRKTMLTLYRQCYKATDGFTLKQILEDESQSQERHQF